MKSGQPYDATDAELMILRQRAAELVRELEGLPHSNHMKRLRVLASLFEVVGDNPEVSTPIHVEYGRHISAGRNLVIGPYCVIVDAGRIKIGDDVRLDAGVHLYAVARPIDANQRAARLEQAAEITLGDGVWIGGHSVINPGVSIGSGTVVAPGSVVLQSLPEGVQAAGNPCRVVREI